MTLKDLSDKIGISISFLSGIERDIYSPSLDVICQISEIFKTSVSRMLGEDKKECIRLIKRENRKEIISEDGKVKLEMLSGEDCDDAKVSIDTVEISAEGSNHLVHRHFGEEIIYVLEGGIQVNVGGNVFNLNKSDCIHFDSNIIHSINNLNGISSKLLITTCPPNHGSTYEAKADQIQH